VKRSRGVWHLIGWWAAWLATTWLASCAQPGAGGKAPGVAEPAAPVAAAPAPAPVPAPPPAPPAPPPILPFDEAVLSAANNLLGKAVLPASTARHALVVDPLIDGVTGMQSNATQAMGARLAELVRKSYPQYDLQPFSTPSLSKSPLVLIGTFTGVNAERKTEGVRLAYRICLALADLKTGKLVSKGLAFATKEGVDITPTPFFRDAPAWVEDPATTGYVRSCQGTRVGDPIHPAYLERIQTAATIAEAIDAYAASRYAEAHKLYTAAAAAPSGKQLRVYSGLYLTSMRLKRTGDAAKAFGEIVEQGFEAQRLGVKFLFRPAKTEYWSDPKGLQQPHSMWLREIATRVQKQPSCVQVVGHASPVGPEGPNQTLSQQRAERVRQDLLRNVKIDAKKVQAKGVGSSEAMIGNGRDDASDALDRRVEFKLTSC